MNTPAAKPKELTNPETTRLAPSPTGALHLGNARTFLVNWALARQSGWKIVLRIEDLDGPRIKPGVTELTIDLLRWLGLDWDSGPIIQSHDLSPYLGAMNALAAAGLVYPSDLSRTEIEASASAPQEGSGESFFPPSLRPPTVPNTFDRPDLSWRFATPPGNVSFTDGFVGPCRSDPSTTIGDFVVWTKRNAPSYQLAVVVDDSRQGVTQIVRGDDLLDSAARQILLYRALNVGPEPAYSHLPLVVGQDGRRLAKRHGDTRLDTYRAAGVPRDRIIGLIATWCGVNEERKAVSAEEFRDRFRLSTIPKRVSVFTPEDHQWLLQSS